ncbi:MAG: VanZ like family [Actinomycetota bacterium]|jgi:glycopeptide antibiotics resistance protein
MLAALLGPLDYMFGETLNLAATVALILAIVFAVSARFNGWSVDRATRNWLWVTSLVVIWIFTQHSPYRGTGRVLDLSPFNDLKAAQISEHRRDLVLGNVALFVPLGMAMAWKGYRVVRAFALALALSVAAETLQYITGHGRIAQLEDVIYNVCGALLGWVMFSAVRGSLKSESGMTREVERRAG